MGLEVELKAHVVEPYILKSRIEHLFARAEISCELKEDIYFCLEGGEALFRLRLESMGPSFESLKGRVVATRKHKSIEGGIEANEEIEFSFDQADLDSAFNFFLSLGYEVYIRKSKRGYYYTIPIREGFPALHLELVEVPPLGWFVEMECMLEDTTRIDEARSLLLETLSLLGIDEEAIESRYYMHLLKAQSSGNRG